jgi:hypothetical protein
MKFTSFVLISAISAVAGTTSPRNLQSKASKSTKNSKSSSPPVPVPTPATPAPTKKSSSPPVPVPTPATPAPTKAANPSPSSPPSQKCQNLPCTSGDPVMGDLRCLANSQGPCVDDCCAKVPTTSPSQKCQNLPCTSGDPVMGDLRCSQNNQGPCVDDCCTAHVLTCAAWDTAILTSTCNGNGGSHVYEGYHVDLGNQDNATVCAELCAKQGAGCCESRSFISGTANGCAWKNSTSIGSVSTIPDAKAVVCQ